jgi:hypothetical protein
MQMSHRANGTNSGVRSIPTLSLVASDDPGFMRIVRNRVAGGLGVCNATAKPQR